MIKKKKRLLLETVIKDQDQNKYEPQKLGSAEYLSDRKFDLIDKELRKNLKEHETSKRLLILNSAQKYEKAGYPTRLICKRISDLLSNREYGVSDSYVRKILPEKYKNLDQMNFAKQQTVQGGVTYYRQREIVARKDIKDITVEDFKYITMAKAKAAFKHQVSRADLAEQIARQFKDELEKTSQNDQRQNDQGKTNQRQNIQRPNITKEDKKWMGDMFADIFTTKSKKNK